MQNNRDTASPYRLRRQPGCPTTGIAWRSTGEPTAASSANCSTATAYAAQYGLCLDHGDHLRRHRLPGDRRLPKFWDTVQLTAGVNRQVGRSGIDAALASAAAATLSEADRLKLLNAWLASLADRSSFDGPQAAAAAWLRAARRRFAGLESYFRASHRQGGGRPVRRGRRLLPRVVMRRPI